ncbi:MAG: hypothetical protein HYZ29_15000 [Myxococcales bacterium]|nr:hypothetical protein [Myxococcales bacterium]
MKPWALSLLLVACDSPAPSSPPARSTSASPASAPAPSARAAASTASPPAEQQAPAENDASTAPSAAAGEDAISERVKQLDAHGLWTNGMSPHIPLPSTASTAEVVAKVLAVVGFDKGHVKTHRVVTEREVQVGTDPKPYRAAIVESDLGKKVLFMRYEPDSSRWWSRVYDAN